MPRAKPKPPTDVLTLSEAAAYLRLPEAEVVRMVHEQDLVARQGAPEWRFRKSDIQHWLCTGPVPELGPTEETWIIWKKRGRTTPVRRKPRRGWSATR